MIRLDSTFRTEEVPESLVSLESEPAREEGLAVAPILTCGLDPGLHCFYESLFECKVCNSTWSVNHGVTEVIKDTQAKSFLQGLSEAVEGDDYNVATGTAR